ncbi:MAG: hypothetical protein HKN37_07360 [Rhodothermales bacterium]|nr:hypothetical protein [Rhodothermales bacterium]
MKGKTKLGVYLFLGALIVIAFLESIGTFDTKHYFEVPHGSHTHYVAKDRDPNVSVSQFPTRPPGPGERISPQGQVVKVQ